MHAFPKIHRWILLVPIVLLITDASRAQHHPPQHSPYADHVHRTIAALPDAEIESLLAGEGMGLALPAELNGYPGPRHVLDMADALQLTANQRAATQRIFREMNAEAVELGREIVELERALNAAFAEASIDSTSLVQYVGQIESRRARLREVHLLAHLALYPVLTSRQRAMYDRLRGYSRTH